MSTGKFLQAKSTLHVNDTWITADFYYVIRRGTRFTNPTSPDNPIRDRRGGSNKSTPGRPSPNQAKQRLKAGIRNMPDYVVGLGNGYEYILGSTSNFRGRIRGNALTTLDPRMGIT